MLGLLVFLFSFNSVKFSCPPSLPKQIFLSAIPTKLASLHHVCLQLETQFILYEGFSPNQIIIIQQFI